MGTLDPLRTEVFNLRDCTVEISDEAGPTILTDYLIYVDQVNLRDNATVQRSFQAGRLGRRLTTLSHDYTLSMSRFQAKHTEDFQLAVDPKKLYEIKLIMVNEQSPSLTETHTLKHCQIESRSIKMGELVNTVPTQWAVGEYTPPT